MAGDKRPKRPTLKELAKEAGVSVASASYALNGNGSVGAQTRQHILEVAKRIGYRQNSAARTLKSGRSGAVGLVLPDLTNPFFPSFAQAVIQTARDQGYSVFLVDTEGSESVERDSLQMLADRGVDGVIWFPIRDEDTSAGALADVPTVVVDRYLEGFDSVLADYAGGGRLAAEHLLAAGHRRIGVITGPEDIQSMRERCDAAVQAIEKQGVLAFKAVNAFSIDLEPSVVEAIDTGGATAVFAGADVIAIGVIRHLAAKARPAPQSLSIIGFDDIPWSELNSPALTTVEMPLHAMAIEAVQTLVQRIEQGDGAPRTVVLNTNLVVRDSVRQAKTLAGQ
jgi:LacI family transcriptional regulator